MTEVLMPKATAVWLVDNTALTFDQIAEFCGLHSLEVKGIADGDVAVGVRGADPISNGQLTREEIETAEGNEKYRMTAVKPKYSDLQKPAKRRGPRYTPLSRRQIAPMRSHGWSATTRNCLTRKSPNCSELPRQRLVPCVIAHIGILARLSPLTQYLSASVRKLIWTNRSRKPLRVGSKWKRKIPNFSMTRSSRLKSSSKTLRTHQLQKSIWKHFSVVAISQPKRNSFLASETKTAALMGRPFLFVLILPELVDRHCVIERHATTVGIDSAACNVTGIP